jgi:hypothetical protein
VSNPGTTKVPGSDDSSDMPFVRTRRSGTHHFIWANCNIRFHSTLQACAQLQTPSLQPPTTPSSHITHFTLDRVAAHLPILPLIILLPHCGSGHAALLNGARSNARRLAPLPRAPRGRSIGTCLAGGGKFVPEVLLVGGGALGWRTESIPEVLLLRLCAARVGGSFALNEAVEGGTCVGGR